MGDDKGNYPYLMEGYTVRRDFGSIPFAISVAVSIYVIRSELLAKPHSSDRLCFAF
jgi:hypothetical protein